MVRSIVIKRTWPAHGKFRPVEHLRKRKHVFVAQYHWHGAESERLEEAVGVRHVAAWHQHEGRVEQRGERLVETFFTGAHAWSFIAAAVPAAASAASLSAHANVHPIVWIVQRQQPSAIPARSADGLASALSGDRV